MIRIGSIIFAIVLLSSTVSASPWVESCSVILHPNQNTSCGLYNISNVQFSSPVKAHEFNGNVIMDSNVIPSVVLQLNNQTIIVSTDFSTYESDDSLIQVTADSFTPGDSMLWEYSQYNPKATIHINVREQPSLSVSVSPEYSSYVIRPNTNILWIVSVQNTGDIDVHNVRLHVPGRTDVSLGDFTGKQQNVVKYNISTEIPYPNNNNNNITLNVSIYYDYILVTDTQRSTVNASSSAILETLQNTPIEKSVFLYKTIQPRIYTENNTVTLSLTNPSAYYLTDIIITDKFKSSGINHTWKFNSMKSGESKTVSYIVRPSQVGSFTSPSGVASFRINGIQYSVMSNTKPVTVVSMNNKADVSADEIYIAPTPIKVVLKKKITAQPTTAIPQTSQPTTAQTPQMAITPTFRIPGFKLLFGIIGFIGIAWMLKHGR